MYRWLVGNLRLWKSREQKALLLRESLCRLRSIIPNVSSFEVIHCQSRYVETVKFLKCLYLITF